MKKTYMIPATTVVKVGLSQMIASSPVDGFNNELNTTGSGGSNALSRRGGSLWDDDDDEY